MKIKLEYLPIVRLGNTEPFIVPEKLEVEFESVYKLEKLVVEVKKGDEIKKFVVKDQKIDLSEFTKQAGVIEMHVSLMALGKVAKTWEIEPIVVVETEGTFTIKGYIDTILEPYLESVKLLSDNNNEIIEKFNDLAEKHNELALTVKEIKENF